MPYTGIFYTFFGLNVNTHSYWSRSFLYGADTAEVLSALRRDPFTSMAFSSHNPLCCKDCLFVFYF